MAVDRITKDMRSMARSYNAPKPVALMQDKLQQAKSSIQSKAGAIKTARDAANDKAKNTVSGASSALGKSVVKGATAAAKSIQTGFEGLKQRNTERHRELINSQRAQTNLLTGMNKSVGGIHNMMFKDKYGPKVEPYKRDTGGDVSQLADQLGRQHNEIMQELEKIRRAILMGGGGGLGSLLGALRPGGRRNRRNRGPSASTSSSNNRGPGASSSNNNRGPGASSSNRPSTTSSGSSSSWGRAGSGGSVGGGSSSDSPSIKGGGWRGRLLNAGLALGAAGVTGYSIFGGGGGSESPPAGTISGSSGGGGSSATHSYGLGSIAASNETTRGVHEISSGEGDHGGVSYGAHQLATETGSMRAFLNSEEGRPFAAAFGNTNPGTDAFNQIYRQVALNHEEAFARAQKAYIDRTHYEPMFNNVMRGSGFDASQRGPAIQEMLYSTGVQYGTGTSVINRALSGHNPDQMSDADIIRVVQNFKGQTVGTYFRSSRPDVQESVRNRAYREMDQLLALDAQYQNDQMTQQSPSSGSGGSQGSEVSETQMASSTVTSAPPAETPLMGDGGSGNGLVTAAGAGVAVAAVGGASLMNSGASTPAPAAAPPASIASPTRLPDPPANVRRQSSPLNQDRLAAARAVSQSSPPPSIAAPSSSVVGSSTPTPSSASTPDTPSGWSKARGGARALPVISTALGVYDVATIATDDSLTTGEKAGEITDIAGGTVGGIVGAKAGAAVGGAAGLIGGPLAPLTVPIGAAVGGLIGGFGGYIAGTKATNTARNWVGDQLEEGEETVNDLPDNHPLQAGRRAEAQRRRRQAGNGAEEPQTQHISADAIIAANQIAALPPSEAELAALNRGNQPAVSGSALTAAAVVGETTQEPVVVNNYPLQGEDSDGTGGTGETPESEVTSATQVSQDASAASGSEEDSENSMLMDMATQAIFGETISAGLSVTRPDAPEHMRQNLHGYDGTSTAPSVQSATQVAATASAGGAAAASIPSTPEDAENSMLMNMASQMLFGETLSAGLSVTRPDAPEHMRQNLHGYGNEPAAAPPPTTVREGNRVTHDFTNRPPPTKPNTGQEITEDDLNTQPVGQSRVASAFAGIEAARNQIMANNPLDQASRAINDIQAQMSVIPATARSSLSALGTRVQGATAPAPGTAPGFMGEIGTSQVSVGTTGASRAPSSTPSAAADFSTQAVNDVPSRRQQHDSVQKVMMMEQPAPTHERKDLTQDPRSSSTSSTYEGRNHQPSIDETPLLVSDFGLTLLNTGFI